MTENREMLIKLVLKAVGCDRLRSGEIADRLITNGVAVQRWIPVTERLPERNERVLCRYVFGEYNDRPFYQVLDYYAFDPHPHFQHEGTSGMCVTHWMPLPEPPKEE